MRPQAGNRSQHAAARRTVGAARIDDASGHSATYSGYLKQDDIWGAYQGEVF